MTSAFLKVVEMSRTTPDQELSSIWIPLSFHDIGCELKTIYINLGSKGLFENLFE